MFKYKEKGQGLVEYALVLVLTAVVVIVILALLGPPIGNMFSGIAKQFEVNTQIVEYCNESGDSCLTIQKKLGTDDSKTDCAASVEFVFKDEKFVLKSCRLVAQ